MLGIVKYIFKNNDGFDILKYLVFGFIFQLFKRVTKSVVSKKIFNGKNIFMYPQCNVSTMYAYTEIPDKKEIFILRDLIKGDERNDTAFFDIGANIGSYSISLMDICSEIIAFEPHPYTANRCKMNFLLNNISENSVKQLAISNKIGSIHFSDYGGSSTINHIVEEGSGIEVEVSTLDKFVVDYNYSKDRTYILKVDVEGFEKEVFEGAKEFLTFYNVKGIVFECFAKDDVFELLKGYGYKNIKQISENNYFATKN